MSAFALCSESIDWSATGSMLGGLASLAAFFVAFCALNTWKKDIDLQDQYQKIDALARSFILVMRAGHDWQWDCGVGEERDALKIGEKWWAWLNALANYRVDWELAKRYMGNECEDLAVFPVRLEELIIGTGRLLAKRENVINFITGMESSLKSGIAQIFACRDPR